VLGVVRAAALFVHYLAGDLTSCEISESGMKYHIFWYPYHFLISAPPHLIPTGEPYREMWNTDQASSLMSE
jgi:hypothetical protein